MTSNLSQSANNVFEKARTGSWLHSIDTKLATIMERVISMRKQVEGKDGVVEHVQGVLKKC
jgi:hypothetical protein